MSSILNSPRPSWILKIPSLLGRSSIMPPICVNTDRFVSYPES